MTDESPKKRRTLAEVKAQKIAEKGGELEKGELFAALVEWAKDGPDLPDGPLAVPSGTLRCPCCEAYVPPGMPAHRGMLTNRLATAQAALVSTLEMHKRLEATAQKHPDKKDYRERADACLAEARKLQEEVTWLHDIQTEHYDPDEVRRQRVKVATETVFKAHAETFRLLANAERAELVEKYHAIEQAAHQAVEVYLQGGAGDLDTVLMALKGHLLPRGPKP